MKKDKLRTANKTINPNHALAVLCGSAFLVPFMGSAINLALPQISDAFAMKAVTLTWIATSYLIATAIFQIPFARVADLIGRKKIFLTGVSIFCVCSIMCGFSTSGAMLITLRFLSGIGSAMMFGTNIAILTSLFPPEQRGRALGINVAVVYAALAAGPFFGGMLTHYFGWQSIFFFSAGMGLCVLTASAIILRGEWVEARGEKFDLPGSILYGIALAGIIYGFSILPSAFGFACLGIGILAMFIFIWFEKRRQFPVFNVRLFGGNRIFALSSLAALINYASTMGIGFMLSLYLQFIRGMDASHAGLVIICMALVQSIFSLIAGWLTGRYSPMMLATAGMIMICVGLTGLLFLKVDTPIWMLISLLVLFGIGFGLFSSPNTNIIMSSVDRKDYSQASATTGTMRLAGQSFSMGIAGMAISFTMGNEKLVPALYSAFMQSMKITFVIFLILCMIGVYASSVRNREKR